MKSPTGVPGKAQENIKTALTGPRHNLGKDIYIIALNGHEKTYWLGTESGLLGAFHFDGVCTVGDGSCDVVSHSMGAGFCNLKTTGCLTGQYPAPLPLEEQREIHSYRVVREEGGMNSNHQQSVALRECIEAHQDHENLLYLTDSEATLQVINKWIGGGSKLSLVRSPDGEVLSS